MNETSPLIRQWRLLAALGARHGGCFVDDLAREHQCSDRTVRRDLLVLRRAGFPLEESLGDHGRKQWTIAAPPSLPALQLNWMEAISLYLGWRFMQPLAGTRFGTSLTAAIAKIRSTLGTMPAAYLNRMAGAFHVTDDRVDYSGKAELLDQLTGAIEERRIVQLTYQSERATEPVTRDVYPVGWVFHNSAAYLVADAPDHGERRLYKLDRVETAHVTKLQFTKPAEFSPGEYLAGALGVFRGGNGQPQAIRVRFHSPVARYVKERRWHASQVLTPQSDGSLVAEFHLTALAEMKSWLLSFGQQALVLEPPELVADLRTEIEGMTQLYKSHGDDDRAPRAQEAPVTSPPLSKGGPGGSGEGHAESKSQINKEVIGAVAPPPPRTKPRKPK